MLNELERGGAVRTVQWKVSFKFYSARPSPLYASGSFTSSFLCKLADLPL